MATKDFPEHKDNILLLTLGPLIWAAHLLLSYGTASIWCGKMVETGRFSWRRSRRDCCLYVGRTCGDCRGRLDGLSPASHRRS